MAISVEIPEVVGTKMSMACISNNDIIILDAVKREILVNPNESEIYEYEKKVKLFQEKKNKFKKIRN